MKSANHFKSIALSICALTTAVLCACSSGGNSTPTEAQPTAEYTLSPAHRVIIDTDTGADDASALILAAKAPNIEIIGVTTLVGNTDLEQGTKNALAALELAGCDAPVFRGSSENYNHKEINAFSVFGKDGMGDKDLIHPNGTAEDKDAIDFILETVAANPDEIEIISIGPATNIAKAIERDPDTMKKVKMIWSMGTAGRGPGNATPVAEFNVYSDPDAYKVMLDSGIDITVIGLDMCGGEAEWTNEQFDRLDKEGKLGHFVTLSFTKLREFYVNKNSDAAADNCDSMAMMCVIYENFITDTICCHGSCQTENGETLAEVIFYQKDFAYDIDVSDKNFDYNVTLVTGVAKSDFFDLYLRTISE